MPAQKDPDRGAGTPELRSLTRFRPPAFLQRGAFKKRELVKTDLSPPTTAVPTFFLHASELAILYELAPGDRVSFVPGTSRDGRPRARNVAVI